MPEISDMEGVHPATREPPNWAAIRREYETTNVSLQELATRHGLASRTSIRRKRDADGWIRDMEAITAGLVVEAVAQSARSGAKPLHPAAQARQRPTDQPTGDRDELVQGVDSGHTGAPGGPGGHTGGHIGRHTGHIAPDLAKQPVVDRYLADFEADLEAAEEGIGQARVPEREAEREAEHTTRQEALAEQEDRRQLRTAQTTAQIQARVIGEALDRADVLGNTGVALAQAITAYLQAEPETRWIHGRKLLMGEKESLAGVANAAANMIDKASNIARRAVGLDRNNQPKEVAASENARSPAYVDELLRRLPADALLQLRQVTLELTRAPSVMTVEGTVEP